MYIYIYIYIFVRTSTVLLIRTSNPMDVFRVLGVSWNFHQIEKLNFLNLVQIQIKPKSQFEFVPQHTEESEFFE